MQTIKLSLLEFHEGEFQGVKYSNIHARYNGKILKFKLDRNKVRRPFSISRARKQIRRLIACNSGEYPEYTDKFVTFTFAENITGLKEVNEM
jgi:hypothetical protein